MLAVLLQYKYLENLLTGTVELNFLACGYFMSVKVDENKNTCLDI